MRIYTFGHLKTKIPMKNTDTVTHTYCIVLTYYVWVTVSVFFFTIIIDWYNIHGT